MCRLEQADDMPDDNYFEHEGRLYKSPLTFMTVGTRFDVPNDPRKVQLLRQNASMHAKQTNKKFISRKLKDDDGNTFVRFWRRK